MASVVSGGLGGKERHKTSCICLCRTSRRRWRWLLWTDKEIYMADGPAALTPGAAAWQGRRRWLDALGS